MKKALLFSLISLFTVVNAVDSDITQEENTSEEVGSKESLNLQEKITRYILPAMFPLATLSLVSTYTSEDKPSKKALVLGALVKAGALLHPKTCSTALIVTAFEAGFIGTLIVHDGLLLACALSGLLG